MIPQVENDQKFLIAALFEIGLGVIALVLGLMFGPDPREFLPKPDETSKLLTGIGWGLVAMLPMFGAALIIEKIPLDCFVRLNELTRNQIAPMLQGLIWPQLLLIALAAGVGEELLFRGWLQVAAGGGRENLDPLSLRMMAAVILSSFCFGACHALNLTYFVVASVFGMVLGGVFIWSENLLTAIVAHAAYDAIMMLRILRQAEPIH